MFKCSTMLPACEEAEEPGPIPTSTPISRPKCSIAINDVKMVPLSCGTPPLSPGCNNLMAWKVSRPEIEMFCKVKFVVVRLSSPRSTVRFRFRIEAMPAPREIKPKTKRANANVYANVG